VTSAPSSVSTGRRPSSTAPPWPPGISAGGRGVAQPLSRRDRELAEHLGPILAARGLLLVGLDVIGECITEINVTSPTCFQEITQQTGFDVAAMFVDALEAALRDREA